MVKLNTKPSPKPKKLTAKKKKELLTKLETTVHNVANKGLYFVSGTKQTFYKVIDSKNKRITYTDISVEEAADAIKEILNKATIKDHAVLIKQLNLTVAKHQKGIDKLIMDLRFYKHSIEVTKDFEKMAIMEAREQDAYGKYLYLKDEYISSLFINRTHYSHSITNIATFR
jgi:hypothetical protein|tara:strand:- start:642 stop:1154 length:513 start_codon:yes stop_codon:yes gene_type:complete